MLNGSDEMKCQVSLLVLPSSRGFAKTDRKGMPTFPFSIFFLWQAVALDLPEAEVTSGSLCSKTTEGLDLSNFFFNWLQGLFCHFLFMML